MGFIKISVKIYQRNFFYRLSIIMNFGSWESRLTGTKFNIEGNIYRNESWFFTRGRASLPAIVHIRATPRGLIFTSIRRFIRDYSSATPKESVRLKTVLFFFSNTDSWEKNWVYSEHPGKEFGKFVLSHGKFWNDPENDKGEIYVYVRIILLTYENSACK